MATTAEIGPADVLLVDVEPQVIAELQSSPRLSSLRLIVSSQSNGVLGLAAQAHPSVAVVNVGAAPSHRPALIAMLKELDPALAVIATSDRPDAETELSAYEQGATLYLPLPLDAELLCDVIESCLSRSHGRIGGVAAIVG